jgi:hypothetical protein
MTKGKEAEERVRQDGVVRREEEKMRKGGGVGVKRKMENGEGMTEELMKSKREGRRV